MLTGALNDAVNNNTVYQKLTEIEKLDVGQKFDGVVIHVILTNFLLKQLRLRES